MPVHLAKLGMSRSKLDHKLFMNEQRLSLLAYLFRVSGLVGCVCHCMQHDKFNNWVYLWVKLSF